MERKKILIVSFSFFPQNTPRSFRTTELVKELSRQGHDVTVLTTTTRESFELGEELGFKVKKINFFDVNKNNKSEKSHLIKKILNRFKEQFLLYPQFKIRNFIYNDLKNEENESYDLLISIAAPHPVHWGVSKALKKCQNISKCWIADCGDPFMLSHNLQYRRPFYFKYFEKDFCRNADHITIPAANAKDGYYREFHSKLEVIPQGFNFEDVRIDNNRKKTEVIEFGYAGSLIEKRRDPSEFLSFLSKRGIDFRFIIFSKNKLFVNKLLKEYPNQIIYRGEAPRLDVLYNLSGLDFVINFENVGTNQTPSKLIDYAIIDKPILAIKYGALNEEIVDEFMKGNYTSGIKVENLEQYKIQNVASNFLKLCSNG